MNGGAASGVEFFLHRERVRAALCLFVSGGGQSHTHLVGRRPQGGGLEGLGHASCACFFFLTRRKKKKLCRPMLLSFFF